MGGFAGLLGGTMNAVGQVGVSLKSKRDYEQEGERFEAASAQAAANLAQSGAYLTYTNQENATRGDRLTELQRKRAWEAEDRATIQEYIKGVSPPQGWKPSDPVVPAGNARGMSVAGRPLPQGSIGIPVPLPGSVAAPGTQKPVFQTIMGPLQPGYSAGSWQWRDPLAAQN